MRPITYTKYSSDELWSLCMSNDHKAFKILFDREFKHLLAFGLKVCPCQSDVKDAMQEIFTDLWVKRSTRKINHVKLYLLKSLKYRLIKSKPNGKVIDINSLAKGELSYTTEIISDIDSQSYQVKSILSQLPKQQQEILHLKYFQGLTNAQIAEVLDINYQSVSNRIHRILNGFRKKIQNKASI